MPIHFTNDARDMRLVNGDPLSFLVAMLLDQQFPIAAAFQGPNKLAGRLQAGVDLDALPVATIAEMDPDVFVALASAKPGIHRFPKSMAGRIQALCAHIVEHYDGDAGAIWRDEDDATSLASRLAALPGFGEEKVRISVAALVKRFGLVLANWETVAAPFHDDEPRSVADIGGPADFDAVKTWKKLQKAKGLEKDDSPRPS